MKVFTESVALAWPASARDVETSVCALADARQGNIPVEVRIGVGPLRDEVPLRVLGYAGCVAETIQSDVRILVEPAVPTVTLFSSAPKTDHFDRMRATTSLVALAGSLRLAGLTNRIAIDFAENRPEIPIDLNVDLDEKLAEWIVGRALRHRPEEEVSFQYAFEHASPTMFGDIAECNSPPFRITVGGATEARFWAVRDRVRAAAAARGARLAPIAGVIIRALRVPWYQPVRYEPPLAAARVAAEATDALALAANPARGGNGALKRELRATRRLINDGGVSELIDAIGTADSALSFARDHGFDLGPRLVRTTGDDQ